MLLLISTQCRAINLNDLKPIPREQREALAEKLKEGEICKRDLADTKTAFDECANGSKALGDPGEYLAMGAFAGAVFAFALCSLTNKCNF